LTNHKASAQYRRLEFNQDGEMKGFRENGFAERRDTAAKAKQTALAKFAQRPSADDPAERERRAARLAAAEVRKARAVKREEEKAAEKLHIAAEKARRAAEKEQEAALAAEREAALDKEQKAARDARYAARKARQ
jgi:hypothetical protein